MLKVIVSVDVTVNCGTLDHWPLPLRWSLPVKKHIASHLTLVSPLQVTLKNFIFQRIVADVVAEANVVLSGEDHVESRC
ncbi:hypothetical protein DY000_02053272 [Brassica cretica]|uniref:Uncharacterized protein n=1 Tax=Brassica cretica TaxID=69181 RepID=A0ABQ7AG27_BRACR|nr:hypothetical protein DY000_02053272 [Brassica cretica]